MITNLELEPITEIKLSTGGGNFIHSYKIIILFYEKKIN